MYLNFVKIKINAEFDRATHIHTIQRFPSQEIKFYFQREEDLNYNNKGEECSALSLSLFHERREKVVATFSQE